MLCVNAYEHDYIDRCRAKVDGYVDAYRAMTAVATDDAAAAAFEPVFFNNLVLALDTYFTHRSRTLEGKDGNPVNEVRVLCASLTQHDGVLVADKAIRLRPETSVSGYAPGDEIALTEAGFVRLADAYFDEMHARFGAPVAV
jgi:hypothetical protein